MGGYKSLCEDKAEIKLCGDKADLPGVVVQVALATQNRELKLRLEQEHATRRGEETRSIGKKGSQSASLCQAGSVPETAFLQLDTGLAVLTR